MWKAGEKIENRYLVEAIFGDPGKSGLGVVYRVRDTKKEAVWALKTIQDGILERHPSAAADFRREALNWIALDEHPHIARAHRLEHFDGLPYLFLEWQSGGDLVGQLRRLKPQETLLLALQFCDAMSHANARGLAVHRDIKPANCLLDARGHLKITDFGLAKALAPPSVASWFPFSRAETPKFARGDEASERLTQADSGMGTLPYMAPEQFKNARDVDVRADIYAFGVTFWEIVTGAWPLQPDEQHDWASIHQNGERPAFPLNRFDSAQSWREPFGELLRRCIAPKISARPANFSVLRSELEPIYRSVCGLPAPPVVAGLELDAGDWCQKGWSQIELSLPRAALESFLTAQKLAPRDPQAFAGEIAACRALGQSDNALHRAEISAQKFPNDGAIHFWRALILCENRQLPAAREAIGRAIQNDCAEPDFWAQLGQIELEDEQFEAAAKAFKRARELNPRHEEALLGFARACHAVSQHDTALRVANTALRINPRFEEAWRLRDQIELECGRGAQLLARVESRLQTRGDDAELWLEKGRVLGVLERPREAIDAFDLALKIAPHLLEAHWQKARAWEKLGRVQEALKCAENGLGFSPHEGEGHFLRGQLLAATGRDLEAYEAFWRARAGGFEAAQNALDACRARLETAGETVPDLEATWFSAALANGTALAQEGLRIAGTAISGWASRWRARDINS